MNENQVLLVAVAAVPTMITVLIGIFINNSRMNDMNLRFSEMRSYMDTRFSHVDSRLDDMRDMWRSELHRLEEVLDARLKHLEDHR